MGGVQNLRAGLLRGGGALLLHAGTNRLHLRLRVHGGLRAGADRIRLGLRVCALTLEAHEHGAFAGCAVQAGGEHLGRGRRLGGCATRRIHVTAHHAGCGVRLGSEGQGSQPEGQAQH